MEKQLIELLREKYGVDTPILTSDIRKELSAYSRQKAFQIIYKAVKNGGIVRFDVGVYYIPTQTENSISSLDPNAVVERWFIKQGNVIYGFISGQTLKYEIGLISEKPQIIEVVTNNEATRVRNIRVGPMTVKARRARTPITNDNYKIMQVLELFNTIDINNYADKMDILAAFVRQSGVTGDEMKEYAKFYPAKALKNFYLSGQSL